jgi:WD40 repeat protein
VFAHAFSPDGTRLVGLNNDLVLMWNLVTGRVAFSMQRSSEVRVFFSPFKGEFYTLSQSGFINVHSVDDGAMLNGMSAGLVFNGAYAYDSERGILVLGGEAGSVQAWDLEARTSLATFKAHEADVAALTLSADGTRLATASESGEVRVWDVSDWRGRASLNTFNVTSAGVTALAFSPSKAQLTVGTLAFVETFNLAEARTLYALAVGVGGTRDLMRYSPDGKYLMAGGGEADLTIMDALTGAIVVQLNGVQGERVGAAFNASGELMVTTAYEKSVTLWNLSQATETTLPAAPLRLGTTRITSVDWTSDGFLIAFFDANGSVYLWGVP